MCFCTECASAYHASLPQIATLEGLYASDFGSYVSFSTLFACFLGFDIPTSSFIFIEMFFIILVSPVFFLNGVNIFL